MCWRFRQCVLVMVYTEACRQFGVVFWLVAKYHKRQGGGRLEGGKCYPLPTPCWCAPELLLCSAGSFGLHACSVTAWFSGFWCCCGFAPPSICTRYDVVRYYGWVSLLFGLCMSFFVVVHLTLYCACCAVSVFVGTFTTACCGSSLGKLNEFFTYLLRPFGGSAGSTHKMQEECDAHVDRRVEK